MTDWIEVRITSSVDSGELLSRLEDPSIAGAWQENGIIRVYWPHTHWSSDVLERLKRTLQALGTDAETMTVETLPEQDWNARWAESVRPIRIGRSIYIRPSWEQSAGRDDVELVIDPKQAFGTGHHATTRLLLEWLETSIRGGEQVLDIGTGSGILAMVALRLGARSALGIDHDPTAIDCARGYARENRFGSELQLHVKALAELSRRQFDLVLANLDYRTLSVHAQSVVHFLSAGGELLCSGLLAEDGEDLIRVLQSCGAIVHEQRASEGWLALRAGVHRSAVDL
jgi:ribosomal protein L11 methyltransferase